MSSPVKVAIGGGLLLLVILAATALIVGSPEKTGASSPAIPGISISTGALYATNFPDLQDQQQSLAQWQNQLLVINFWATWCAPCKEEMPILERLQEKYGAKSLQIIGIAADSRLNVASFAKLKPMNYPLLPGEGKAIEFSKRLGNRLGVLPHTLVISAGGSPVYVKFGGVTEAELDLVIRKNLPK